MTAQVARAPLEGIRVLDLATERAELTGRVLADLGADVLKVEPPEGAAARHLPPFDERRTGAETAERRSLYWAAVAAGKRSLVLDLDRRDHRGRLLDLAAEADVLVESFDPGFLDRRDLGYAALSALNPRLVYASVTPFGFNGPKAQWPATELTIEAASGRLSLQGDRDRPPVPIGYPQAAFHAGAQAAADIVIALNERERSGLGQRLDTSMTEVMIWTLMNGTQYPPATGHDPPAGGDDRAISDARGAGEGPPIPCADGWVNAAFPPALLGQILGAIREELGERFEGELAVPPDLVAVDADAWADAVLGGAIPWDQIEAALAVVLRFVSSRTKGELFRWAAARGMRLAPINSTADVLDEPHFRDRGFWSDVEGTTHPGPFARLSRTPLAAVRPAPALGGDDREVTWRSDRWAPRAVEPEGARLGEAFDGLKVVDFTWVAAGPMTAKALGDHGARVIRVESATRLDVCRRLPPFTDDVIDFDQSWWMANVNSSKRGISLNLATEEGRAVARRLVDWSDVVVESFTPGVMERFGLGYEALAANRDDLIMLSTSLLGQTGPKAAYGGFGSHGAAIAGFQAITGWPDRPPIGPSGPYTDVVTPRFAVPALAAAVLERRRSGLGQHIDLSQVEAAMRFLEPPLLDQTVNGRTLQRGGHASATAAPHGVYGTRGTERYIALAVETGDQWRALRSIAPLEDFADERFEQLAQRQSARREIDDALRAWFANLDGRTVEAELVAGGVPAAVVQRMTDLHADPQLAARGFFQVLPHRASGAMTHDGLTTHFSAKRQMLHSSAPILGEHTEEVLREILGLDGEAIASLAAAGALT